MKNCTIRVIATGEVLTVVISPWGWLTSSGLSYAAEEVEVVNTRSD